MNITQFKTLFLFATFQLVIQLGTSTYAFAQDSGDGANDAQAKCTEALDNAYKSLGTLVQVNNSVISPASVNAEGSTGSPLGDLVAKIGEGINKQAELEEKIRQQKEQVEDERYKQGLDFKSKLRDYRKESYKLKQEVTSLEFAKKKADAQIKRACDDEADQKYDTLYKTNQGLAASTNFSTGSMASLSGTRNRMISQKEIFRKQCLAKPQTQDAFCLNIEDLNAKMRNVLTESERIACDVKDVKELVPAMNTFMDRKLASIDDSAARQSNALAQANAFNMMAAATAISTASSTAQNGTVIAGTTTSAMDTFNNFQAIRERCSNSFVNQAVDVPTDVYNQVFLPVNQACRGEGQFCVRASGAASSEMRNRANSSGTR